MEKDSKKEEDKVTSSIKDLIPYYLKEKQRQIPRSLEIDSSEYFIVYIRKEEKIKHSIWLKGTKIAKNWAWESEDVKPSVKKTEVT